MTPLYMMPLEGHDEQVSKALAEGGATISAPISHVLLCTWAVACISFGQSFIWALCARRDCERAIFYHDWL